MRLGKIGICAILAASAFGAEVQVIEQIIAKVNGDIITRSDIERSRDQVIAEMRERGRMPADQIQKVVDEREKDALRDQIDQLLLIQRGKEMTINIDPEVTKQIFEIQANTKITDTDKFHAYIREQTGMSFEDFKAQMKNNMLTRRVIQQEVGSRISVPKEEIAKYYEEHKTEFVREEQVFLREIFLSTQGKTPEQVAAIEKKANDLVARARKGEKFPEMARDNSDSDTAKNFGELGWWKRGQLLPEVEQVVFNQKKNFVTDAIKRDGGFLIIKLEERHEKGQAPLEEAENEIMERLYGQRMPPRVREFLTKLREDAFLEIRDGFVDSGAAPGKDTGWRDPAELKPETVTKAEVASQRRRKLLWMFPMGTEKLEEPAPDQSSQPAGEQAPAKSPAN